MDGRVTQVQGGESVVRLSDGRSLNCLLRGTLRNDVTNPVAVGDRVAVTETKEGKGMIESVGERRTRLSRRSAHENREQVIIANVDQIVVVVSARKPAYKLAFIDRLLVAASNGDLEAAVVVNKLDLAGREAVLEDFREYPALGIPVVFASALTGEGIDAVREVLRDRTSVLAGPSGVGKSSLLNAIEPGLGLRTGEVSDSTNKGKHVTTRVTLLDLSCGGFVADTPGVRSFGIWDVAPERLGWCFPEMRSVLGGCKFSDCLHVTEPGCAVRRGVEDGGISRRRYESYVHILETLETEG